MTEEKAVYLEPSNLTQKISRNTKGIMVSLGILVVSASLATVGTIIDEWITMTLGYVVAGISSVSYLVFFILFIANSKKFGRIEKNLIGVTNGIYASFIYAFFFTVAGFAAIYGSIMNNDPSFAISRVYGFLALICYMFLFLSIDKLFSKLNSLSFYAKEKRRKKYSVLILGVIFLMEVADTILRPILSKHFIEKYNENWYRIYVNRPMTWVVLVILIITIGFICFELYKLSNDWLEIDDKINKKFFQLQPKSFDDKFRNNSFMFYLSFSMSIFLSVFYVLGYLIMYPLKDTFESRWAFQYKFNQFGFSIGPFVGLSIVMTVLYLIFLAFRYQKISHLTKETSNFGILITIATTLSPFILITGFFFNVTFESDDTELFLISRILMIVGLLLFSLGMFFNTRSLDGLKKTDQNEKNLKERTLDLLVPLLSLTLILVLIIDTILRSVLVNYYTNLGYDYEEYVGTTIWTGWVFIIVNVIILVGIIYGYRRTENEILELLPNFGKIPVKVKKAKVVVQPTVVEPEVKQVKPVVVPKIGHCSSCGKKIDDRFRFCPFCGVQDIEKETIPKGKFCANCGETIEERFRFCPSCGVQFN